MIKMTIEQRLVNVEDSMKVLVPIINDCAMRLDAVETALAMLIPAIDKVTIQQRDMIAELKAQLAVKDAELARLKGDVTLN